MPHTVARTDRPPARSASRWIVPSVRAFGWAGLMVVTGLLVRAEVSRPESLDGVETYRGIVYRRGDERRLALDLHLPAGSSGGRGWPAVVAIHGGGWRGGSREDMGRLAGRLAQHGLAVVAIDYTLSRPGAPSWPANLHDVRAAVRWVRRHATRYGIDPDRIAALGASAGGHLAALVAANPGEHESRLDAVVALYAPSDLNALSDICLLPGGPVDLLLGGLPGDRPLQTAAASPVLQVGPDTPPMLLIHGADDEIVPPDQSHRLAGVLARHGVAHRVIVLDDAAHGFGLTVGHRDLVPDLLAFLNAAWNDGAEVQEVARIRE